MAHAHRFECHLVWTGAASGPTSSYASYSRAMRVEVPGKPPLDGSAAPVFRGDGRVHNPEDLLVVALSECHCLSYLALCARAGIVVVAYEDDAFGEMREADGVTKFREVTLRPRVTVAHRQDLERANALHDDAHAQCYIANSVNFPVSHEPTIAVAGEAA